ncbi:MAG: N-acetylmuramoyl-L-alanine amidase-like domain-containing protein [Oligoflexus sp.]|jgi:hypothetical protein
MKVFLIPMVLSISLVVTGRADGVSVEEVSRPFLGLPYGSGAHIVDKELMAPSYDCMTYVETVMALYLATKDESASALLNRIRYFEGKREEALRKHFVETDWISDNQRLGFVTDITRKIMPTAPSLSAWIDKSAWFRKVHPKFAQAFEASSLPKKINATLDYIPLEVLLPLVGKIPDGAIIIFIQNDVNKLLDTIKTPLIVGHMGLAVKFKGELKLRQADLRARKIKDTNLIEAMLASKKLFRGITVLEIRR